MLLKIYFEYLNENGKEKITLKKLKQYFLFQLLFFIGGLNKH